MKTDTLLVIDLPDERSGARREFDHMHAWGTRMEMAMLQRRLEDQFGSGRNHQVVDGLVCPLCGMNWFNRDPQGISRE